MPIKILPELKKALPEIIFEVKDPNETLEITKNSVILDTVCGIKKVTAFNDIDAFSLAPRQTTHDFDLVLCLKYLAKLKKLPKIKIIGLPPTISENKALEQTVKLLKAI